MADFNALQFDLILNLMGFVTRGVSSFRLFWLLGVETGSGYDLLEHGIMTGERARRLPQQHLAHEGSTRRPNEGLFGAINEVLEEVGLEHAEHILPPPGPGRQAEWLREFRMQHLRPALFECHERAWWESRAPGTKHGAWVRSQGERGAWLEWVLEAAAEGGDVPWGDFKQ